MSRKSELDEQEEIRLDIESLEQSIARAAETAEPGERLANLHHAHLNLLGHHQALENKRETSTLQKFSDTAKQLLGIGGGGSLAGFGALMAVMAAVPAAPVSFAIVILSLPVFVAMAAGAAAGYTLMGKVTDPYAKKAHDAKYKDYYAAIEKGLEKVTGQEKELLGQGLAAFAASSRFDEIVESFPDLVKQFARVSLRNGANAPQAAPNAGIKAILTPAGA